MKKIVSFIVAFLGAIEAYAQIADFTDDEKVICDVFRQEMAEPVRFLSEDAFADIVSCYTFSPIRKDQLIRYCRMKELRKYTYNYLDSEPSIRKQHKETIDNFYLDSINMILIPYNPSLSGKFVSMALMWKNHLKLPSDTEARLMNLALGFSHRLRKNPCACIVREEMDSLIAILSKKQIKEVINTRNSADARIQASRLWLELSQANQTSGIDSTEQVSRAYFYYLRELYVKSYYVEQWELINNNLSDLYAHRPTIIKMYEALGQKEKVKQKHEEYREMNKEKKVDAAFAW